MENNKSRKVAIVDANNFYVSCERVFNPSLEGKKTVVLSNNDGCIIARSQEVKDIGIKMGQPLFLLDEEVKNNIHKYSSNYNLYGDISDRIANILLQFSPLVENYSIDESFIDLSHVDDRDILDYLKVIKKTIQRWVGIPVSIGCGQNKTLAKLCNFISKNVKEYGGVYYQGSNLTDLDNLPIDEVWGIGRKWSKKLNSCDIFLVKDFKKLSNLQAQGILNITGLKTLLELKGEYIHPVTNKFKRPKMVTYSRSFGTSVWRKSEIFDSLSLFLEGSCKVLSRENLQTKRVSVFVSTNRFDEDYFTWHRDIRLDVPSNNPEIIWSQIEEFLEEIPLKLWSKAGVCLKDLIPDNIKVQNIFVDNVQPTPLPKIERRNWQTKMEFLSPRYTTKWEDIPQIY
jgi:DNA polymerase V